MAVAELHATELRYSFNSKLGAKHLASIYRAMSAIPDCFIGVALDAGVPVGVVSGTFDVKGTTASPEVITVDAQLKGGNKVVSVGFLNDYFDKVKELPNLTQELQRLAAEGSA